MARKTLMYRSGALGDTLLTIKLISYLNRSTSSAEITLAGNPAYAAPLRDAGMIHQVLDASASPFHLLYDASPSENDALSRLLAGYDAALFFTQDIGGEAFERMSLLGSEKYLIRPPFPPDDDGLHAADWMLGAVTEENPHEGVDILLAPSQSSLDSSRSLMNKYDLSPNKFVALHPGGGGQAKWPPAGLLAGAARFFCEKSGATPVVIQGPADREPTASFQRAWGRWLPVIQTERLEVLGALLSKASGFLGGDSGVSHLAALSGAPTAALYGPGSNMARWHPLGPRAFFVPWETDGEEIAERLAMLSAKGDSPARTNGVS